MIISFSKFYVLSLNIFQHLNCILLKDNYYFNKVICFRISFVYLFLRYSPIKKKKQKEKRKNNAEIYTQVNKAFKSRNPYMFIRIHTHAYIHEHLHFIQKLISFKNFLPFEPLVGKENQLLGLRIRQGPINKQQ